MTVSSVATGYDGISLLAGNAAYDPAATWLIQRQTLTSNTASITFSSIPTGYSSLQIRFIGRSTRAAADANTRLQFNSDTGTNYTYHELSGSGTAASSGGAASQTYADFGRAPGTTITNTSIFGVGIIDIQDYLSTTKNKTIRSVYGYDTNGTGEIGMRSSVWMSTSAVTSITLFQASSASWLAGSTIALYGMKG